MLINLMITNRVQISASTITESSGDEMTESSAVTDTTAKNLTENDFERPSKGPFYALVFYWNNAFLSQ